jgi:hypothetical protein
MNDDSNRRKGTIFIVDISGYTKFVRETKSSTGAWAIAQLLEVILSANRLGFKISEIEGDAILFYLYGKPYPVKKLLQQFSGMLLAFNEKLEEIRLVADHADQLSIKAVAHYGEITEYQISRFSKLYGEILIEAHRLLKNHIHLNTYILITDAYINEFPKDDVLIFSGVQQCEKYDLGKLCYTYYPYNDIFNKSHRLALVS